MENMDSLWTYQESIDELKQQLLDTSIELESVKAEAGEHMKIHKEYEKQSLQLLNMVVQERDEARGQLHKLLDKLMASNYTTPNTEPLTTVVPRLSPESPLMNPIIPNLSTTESNSFSEPYNYRSQNSSPVNSFFEPVSSPEFSNFHTGDLSNDMGFVNQPFVQEYKVINPTNLVPPSGALTIDQVIDSLVNGKTLPQKGNLFQSMLEAGPLLQTLLVAGPLPRWRNPPPLRTFHIPHLIGKGGQVKYFNQKPTGISIHALRPENTQSNVEMPRGSCQVTSNLVLDFQDLASRSCFGNERGMISPGANGNSSFPTGKRQRFL